MSEISGTSGRNEFSGTSGPAWDLDAPPESEAGPRLHSGVILALAVGLGGLGLGGLAGSVLAPDPRPQFPPAAVLSARDFYVDTVPAAAAKTPTDGALSWRGDAVVILRLQVDNPADTEIRVTSIALDGVTRSRSVLPLDVSVAAHRAAVVDLPLRADCSSGRAPTPVRARLRLSGVPRSAPETVPVTPSVDLGQNGGLCLLLDTELPRGWRTPFVADTTRLEGQDLRVTITDLSAERLDGVLVNNRLLPTVFVGDQLLSTSIRLRPNEPTELRLRGPPPCVEFNGPTPIPSTLRMLVRSPGGMEQRLVVVGPDLTNWLRLDCDR